MIPRLHFLSCLDSLMIVCVIHCVCIFPSLSFLAEERRLRVPRSADLLSARIILEAETFSIVKTFTIEKFTFQQKRFTRVLARKALSYSKKKTFRQKFPPETFGLQLLAAQLVSHKPFAVGNCRPLVVYDR